MDTAKENIKYGRLLNASALRSIAFLSSVVGISIAIACFFSLQNAAADSIKFGNNKLVIDDPMVSGKKKKKGDVITGKTSSSRTDKRNKLKKKKKKRLPGVITGDRSSTVDIDSLLK